VLQPDRYDKILYRSVLRYLIMDVCEVKECPDCASLNIVVSARREQIICKDCGLIFEPAVHLDSIPRGKPKARKKSTKKRKKK
jgi:hypothetical protein